MSDSGIAPHGGWRDIDGKHCLFCGSDDLFNDYGPQRCRDCGFQNIWTEDCGHFDIEDSAKYSCMVAMFCWDFNDRQAKKRRGQGFKKGEKV